MAETISNAFYGDVVVGTYEVDRRFIEGSVVIKTSVGTFGLSEAHALKVAAAIIDVVSVIRLTRTAEVSA